MKKFFRKHKRDFSTLAIVFGVAILIFGGLYYFVTSPTKLKTKIENTESEDNTNDSSTKASESLPEEGTPEWREAIGKEIGEWIKLKHTKQDKPIYITDTIADSNTDINMDNYKYAFVQPDNKYFVKNSDYITTEGGKTDYDNVKSLVTDYVNHIMSVDYKVLSQDKQSYIDYSKSVTDDSNGGFYDVNGDLMSNEELMDEAADWFINNEVQADATFKTDESLIWHDTFYIYLRGELTITPRHIKDGDEKYWPGSFSCFDYRNGGTYIVTFTISRYNDKLDAYGFKPYMIADFESLEKIEE